jgi:hypothetical protein
VGGFFCHCSTSLAPEGSSWVRRAGGRSPLTDAKAGLLFYPGPWTPWETRTPACRLTRDLARRLRWSSIIRLGHPSQHGASDRHIIIPEQCLGVGGARGHDAAMVDAQLAPRVVPTP